MPSPHQFSLQASTPSLTIKGVNSGLAGKLSFENADATRMWAIQPKDTNSQYARSISGYNSLVYSYKDETMVAPLDQAFLKSSTIKDGTATLAGAFVAKGVSAGLVHC